MKTSISQTRKRTRRRRRRCLAYLCWELMTFKEHPMLKAHDYRRFRVGGRFIP